MFQFPPGSPPLPLSLIASDKDSHAWAPSLLDRTLPSSPLQCLVNNRFLKGISIILDKAIKTFLQKQGVNPRGPRVYGHVTIRLSKKQSRLPSLRWGLSSSQTQATWPLSVQDRHLGAVRRLAYAARDAILSVQAHVGRLAVCSGRLTQPACAPSLGSQGVPTSQRLRWEGPSPLAPLQTAGHCTTIYRQPSISFSLPVCLFCSNLLKQHVRNFLLLGKERGKPPLPGMCLQAPATHTGSVGAGCWQKRLIWALRSHVSDCTAT